MSSTKSFPPEAFRRHAFVRLERSAADVADDPEVKAWVVRDRPLVVRRPCIDPDGAVLFLGLALPPSPVKKRIALEMPCDRVEEIFDPPLWSDASSGESRDLTALGAAVLAGGGALRAFGSHAWQYFTGLAYVTPTSDVDLLIDVPDAARWETLRQVLPPSLPPGIDLEIVLQRDASFSWREFCDPNARLLFKGNSRVWMGYKTEVHACLPDR